MELSGVAVGRRSPGRLLTTLIRAERSELTYDHVGSTLEDRPPARVSRHTTSTDLDGSLDDAARTLRRWAPHEGIAALILPHLAPLVVGTTVLVVVSWGPFEVLAPDRIVATVDDEHRFGFAYGTLSGHPERGEELFLAEQVGPDRLRLSITIDAGPGTPIAHVASPLVHQLQHAAAERYLLAWSSAISSRAHPTHPIHLAPEEVR